MISGKNKNILAEGDELLELIPQRPPMVMIDQLLHADHVKTITNFTISPSCIFCEEGFLSENGLVENMAQTAAAGVGYVCKATNKPVPIGFIAAVKNLTIHHLPLEGSQLTTEVVIINEVLNVTIIKGEIRLNEKLLIECEMRIFIKPDLPNEL